MRFYVQNKRIKGGISKMNLKIKTDNSKESTNDSSSPISICKPRHVLRICLGLQPNFSEMKIKIDKVDMIS